MQPESSASLPRLLSPEEFFTEPTQNTIFKDVQAEIDKTRELIDPETLRIAEDWAFLRDRVVGAEGLGEEE